jgi:catechol-2,3-dioxygenase
MTPELDRFDHIHVYVSNRPAAEKWYHDVLRFRRKTELESWAVPHGPLMLQNSSGSIALALFEKSPLMNQSTIAFGVSGESFRRWMIHLSAVLEKPIAPVDHGLAWSIYFADPDGNPFEITTYDYSAISAK